jgi:uracil phosphoribosyltransferase
MEVISFNDTKSVLNNFVSELRDINVQNDKMRFRRNLERIGEYMSYEVSKRLEFKIKNTTTPLGTLDEEIVDNNLVLATILRAGLPMHKGVQNIFDDAENSYISAYRKYDENKNIKIKFEYISGPSYQDKTVILTDPMLATGSSIVTCYEAMKERGLPKHVHILCIIGSEEGVKYVQENIKDENVTLWVAKIDPILNEKGYIVPGLGDAGDLALGEKL